MANSIERPTKSQIMDRLSQLKSHYAQRDSLFDLDDSYYELLFKDELGLPEEYKDEGIVLPTARDIVDAGTNHLSTVYARFLRPRRGDSKEAEVQAEMLRKFDVGMFYRTKVESKISPWRIAAKHLCMYGMCCLSTLYYPDRIPDEPEKEDGESPDDFSQRESVYRGELRDSLPIVIDAVHPRNVYPSLDGSYIIIEQRKNMELARRDWPKWNHPVGALDYKTNITEVTYWDKQYRAVYINSLPLNQTAQWNPVLFPENGDGIIGHDYGTFPFVIAYSGLGNMDKTGKPETMAVGLIRYLKPLLRSESFAYSVYNIVMKAHSWPITFVSGPGAKALTSVKMKFGKIYEKPQGVTIEDFVKSAPPELVQQHMEYTSAILAASAAPRSVRGLPEAGVRSMSDRSFITSQATLKYDGIMEQLQSATAKVMANATKVAERVVPSDFYMWAKTPDEEFDVRINREKIKNHYTTYVEFTPSSPEEEARRHADGINLVRSGIMSAQTVRERYLSHIDSADEEIKVEAEKLRNDPAVRQVLAQIVAGELMAEAARLQKIQQLRAGMVSPNNANPLAVNPANNASAPGNQQMQMPGLPSLSMPMGAQMLSSRARVGQPSNQGQAAPGSMEEMARQMALAGRPQAG